MTWLLGFDDTDDKVSRGTGYRARHLARLLRWLGLAQIEGITRHQLARVEGIPMTSQNSAACIALRPNNAGPAMIRDFTHAFLDRTAAPAAQPGLCLGPEKEVGAEVRDFGRLCKQSLLSLEDARTVAQNVDLTLDSVGDGGRGRIGALSAVGLRAGGDDGRFIWLPHLRSLNGIYSLAELRARVGLAGARTLAGGEVKGEERILLGNWIRPVVRGDAPVLLVEAVMGEEGYGWKLLDKELVRGLEG